MAEDRDNKPGEENPSQTGEGDKKDPETSEPAATSQSRAVETFPSKDKKEGKEPGEEEPSGEDGGSKLEDKKTQSSKPPADSDAKVKPIDKKETAKPKAKSESKSGAMRLVAWTVLATVIVFAGAGYYWRQDVIDLLGLSSGADAAKIAEFEARLAALESEGGKASAATEALAEDLARRDARVAALENEISRLGEGGNEALLSDLELAKSKVQELEQKMAQFEAATGERDVLLSENANPGQRDQVDQSPADAAELATVQSSLAELSERFQSMDETLGESQTRLEALEDVAPPQDLDDILSNLSPRTDIETLEGRLKTLEAANPAGAARLAVVALSATELARAAAGSAPFIKELEAFANLAPDNSLIAGLSDMAARGVPTEKTLLLEFARTADAIAEAERIREGGGFLNWLMNQFTALFSIRKVGEIEGDDWQAILARAENRIAAEDITAAAGELEALQGPAKEAAAPWLEAARNRSRLNALVASLSGQAFLDLLSALEDE